MSEADTVINRNTRNGAGIAGSGSLRRKPLGSSAGAGPLQPPPRGPIKQSSTESGHSTSNRMSLQSSSDGAGRGGRSSLQGTPRDSLQRRQNNSTLPRRTNDFQTANGSRGGGGSLEGTLVKQRGSRGLDQNDCHDKNSSIPLIEFHLVNGQGPTPNAAGGSGGRGNPRPKTAMGRRINPDDIEEENEENGDHFRNRNSSPSACGGGRKKQQQGNKPYIKYNSFANY